MITKELPGKSHQGLSIAYLTNISAKFTGSGGSVHVSQVAENLIKGGHLLFTNLPSEPGPFIKLTRRDFLNRGEEIGVFYIRIDGGSHNDELTLLRMSNAYAPCVWEVNAPLEELRTLGKSEELLRKSNMRRKKLARLVDAAICVSDEMAEYARDELGIKEIFVVPNGSDTERFSPEKRDEAIYDRSRYKVLWSGSPNYGWQGLNIVRELARKCRDKGIDDLLFIVTADGVSTDNIHYLGHIPYAEMPRYIASADLGLCLYGDIDYYRKFYFSPLKLYDYMASGIPVIGTKAGQIKMVIEEQRNGLLTDNAIDDLIDKIQFLKKNSALAVEMGTRGRQAVLEKYNWGNVAIRTESILTGVIERHKADRQTQPQRMLTQATSNYWKSTLSLRVYTGLLRRLAGNSRNMVMRAWKTT
ncbi:MAG: hypothetical protein C0402_14185 [Thermodesulfovibrio sp.]|nr:hypothetical protein [Thermodesulfovibrio sp.]